MENDLNKQEKATSEDLERPWGLGEAPGGCTTLSVFNM